MEERLVFKGIGLEISGTRELLEELVSYVSYGDNQPSGALADIVSEIETILDVKRKDITDKIYSVVVNRYAEEQLERDLTGSERDRIWYAIHGRLCRGESEADVEKWCRTAPLLEKDV